MNTVVRPEDMLLGRFAFPGHPMPQPLATFEFHHARLELYGPDADHAKGWCRTVFHDGLTVPAAPNGRDGLLDTALHEASHLLTGELLFDGPSVCLRGVAEGRGRTWTDDKHREETAAYRIGQLLAELVRAVGRAV
jgi:hypothetical protein